MIAALLGGALALYAAGAVGGIAFRRSDRVALALGAGASAAASALVAAAGIVGFATGEVATFTVTSTMPGLDLAFRADGLASVFLAILGVGAAAAGVYALGYLAGGAHGPFSTGTATAFLNAFLLSTVLVIVADHALVFLVAWESMSLASYFLVLSAKDDERTLAAANQYVIMTHLGFAFLLASFAALAAAAGGSLAFDAMRSHAAGAPAFLKDAAFVGAIVGFGTKAGLVPLHAWLPEAHPAAPSHVSALMSGVMLKTAVYMTARVALDFLAPGPPWWGVTLLVLGGVTTLTGILYATTEDDLKRLLAYSSVENLGVVFMGLGLATLFSSYGSPALATLALVAALLHAFNHMAMKGLLFLAAGSVQRATGTRDVNALGGLIRGMPVTAALFLLGALAISALPPLNGFVGEWLLFQSLLAGVTLPETPLLLQVSLPVGAAFFALAGALSVVCFVKAFGASFLGVPRSEAAARARESPPTMVAVPIVAVAAFAGPLVARLVVVAAPYAGATTPPDLVTSGGVMRSLTSVKASMSPLVVFALIVAFAVASYLATRVLGSRARERRAETWLCGHRALTPRMQYTGTAFGEATRMFFRGFYAPVRAVERAPDARVPLVTRRLRYAARTTFLVEERLYAPTARLVVLTANRLRVLQAGSVHAYLAYIFATLMILLLAFGR